MIRVVMRLLVAFAVLTSPAMASWMATPSMAEDHQPLDPVVDQGSAEGCLPAPSACSLCQACLAVMHDPAEGIEVPCRDTRPPVSAGALVGIQNCPKPFPP